MKKTLLILSIITLVFAGCKKFDEIEASKVEIIEENIEKGWDYIKISGEYDYPVELKSMTLLLSEKEDMSGTKAYDCLGDGRKFSIEVKGLKDGVKYYYCYEYDNGYYKERGEKYIVGTYAKPVVTTEGASNVTTTSVMLKGSVTNNDAINKITALGFCWNTSPNPTLENNFVNNGCSSVTGTSSFTHSLADLIENTTYYYKAYATNEKVTSYGEEKSFTTESLIDGHDWIDLGLPSGLKWATCNVGATTPEGYGDYFAWGETEPAPNNNYGTSNCSTYGLSYSSLQSQGYIDNNGNLTAQHDAATANWGGDWRMPTYDELNELRAQCTWTWTTQNGVIGYRVTGPNGNSIFLPAAGYRGGSSLYDAGSYGYYWSSTPYGSGSYGAYGLDFGSSNQSMDNNYRYYGRSVRPVIE